MNMSSIVIFESAASQALQTLCSGCGFIWKKNWRRDCLVPVVAMQKIYSLISRKIGKCIASTMNQSIFQITADKLRDCLGIK
ncbi:MAG: hypothetical protein Q7K13_03180 [Polynucleobacter sp.]|uniref:hypothetical protein n=1 Tax=Polynucleobacter sp. TaxID=2029855 RepID=UPI0027251650|nr:hypothetical protein [Polynucleobacter sp.]MDO8713467.1 hypothetical protein [Polynucleobacter sp.]